MNLSFIENIPLVGRFFIYACLLFIGVVCLIKFCNIFVDSSSSLSKILGISPLIVGLTVVAIGTSFPELAVAISDSIFALLNNDNANVGFSNVIGSNISNLLLVFAFAGLYTPVLIKKESKKDYGILIFITMLMLIFSLFFGDSTILRWEAIILTSIIFFYIVYIVVNCKKNIVNEKEEEKSSDNLNVKITKIILSLIIGIVGIAIGGELVVYGAKGIAMNFSTVLSVDVDLAENLIGLTVVAVGTSLPELVTTIVASKKKENQMALGNIIGSNIFNIIFVLGISAIIAPFTISSYMLIDLIVMVIVTLFVLIFVVRGKLTRKNSICLLAMYFIYIVYLVVRTLL